MTEWKESDEACQSCLRPEEWEERAPRSTLKFRKGEWFMCPTCDRPEKRSPAN